MGRRGFTFLSLRGPLGSGREPGAFVDLAPSLPNPCNRKADDEESSGIAGASREDFGHAVFPSAHYRCHRQAKCCPQAAENDPKSPPAAQPSALRLAVGQELDHVPFSQHHIVRSTFFVSLRNREDAATHADCFAVMKRDRLFSNDCHV